MIGDRFYISWTHMEQRKSTISALPTWSAIMPWSPSSSMRMRRENTASSGMGEALSIRSAQRGLMIPRLPDGRAQHPAARWRRRAVLHHFPQPESRYLPERCRGRGRRASEPH